MKQIIVAIALIAAATAAYANCTRQTVMSPDGIKMCVQCCDAQGNCNMTCM